MFRNKPPDVNQTSSTNLASDLAFEPHVIDVSKPIANVVDANTRHANFHALCFGVFKNVYNSVGVKKFDHSKLPDVHSYDTSRRQPSPAFRLLVDAPRY